MVLDIQKRQIAILRRKIGKAPRILNKESTDSTHLYFQQIARLAKVEDEDEEALWRLVKPAKDAPVLPAVQHAAFNRLLELNLKLVISVANRFRRGGFETVQVNRDFGDMVQNGNLGLIRAVEKFDPGMGFKFSTYAYNWIQQKITRALEESGTIRLPCHVPQSISAWLKEKSRLRSESDHEPTIEEINTRLKYTSSKINRILLVEQIYTVDEGDPRMVSLDVEIGSYNGGHEHNRLVDNIKSPDPDMDERLLAEEDHRLVHSAINGMPERDAQILKMRYGMEGAEPASLLAVGEKLGISHERVRQLQDRALESLRSRMIRNIAWEGIKKMSRETRFGEEHKEAFLVKFRESHNIKGACADVGISPATVYTTWKRDENFQSKFDAAKKEAGWNMENGDGATERQFSNIIERASQPLPLPAQTNPAYRSIIADLEAQKKKIEAAIEAIKGLGG